MPVRRRADFKEALSTWRRLKNAEDQAYYQNWWQSSSSSLKTNLVQKLQWQNSVTANAVYCHRRGVYRVYLLLQKNGYGNNTNTARRTTRALRTSMRQTTSTTSTMTRTWTRARCTTPEHALRARSLRHTWCWVTCTSWLKFWVPSCHPCTCASLSLSSPLSLSTSICPSPSSPSSSLSCTSSSTLSSTTCSPCKTCAPPRTRGVTTPTTSTPPSQVMSPTTWPSASSATPRVPSPTLPRHRTWTLPTLHSASCSPRHTEDKPITAIQKACQSVSRRRLLCSIEQGNLWEKEMSISQFVLVSRETRTVLTASFLKTPKLRKWSMDQGDLISETAQMHR